MIAYCWDTEGYALESVRVQDGDSIPKNGINVPFPALGAYQAAKVNTARNDWDVVDDYLGALVQDAATGERYAITARGPLPDGVILVTEDALAAEQAMEEALAAMQHEFDAKITAKLNAFVATRQYGNIDTCIGRYLNCSIEAFAIEAAYVQDVNARIWVWAGAYLTAVMAGQKPIPTWEAFEAEMDALFPLEWPIADIRASA